MSIQIKISNNLCRLTLNRHLVFVISVNYETVISTKRLKGARGEIPHLYRLGNG